MLFDFLEVTLLAVRVEEVQDFLLAKDLPLLVKDFKVLLIKNLIYFGNLSIKIINMS